MTNGVGPIRRDAPPQRLLISCVFVVVLALVWLATVLLARWWTRDLGGLTGDTYGALCEIAEVAALAALSAL